MTIDDNNISSEDRELVRFTITGLPEDQWRRLQKTLFSAIERVAAKMIESTDIDGETINTTKHLAEDVMTIATTWAKAKIEKPSLENELIKAEITEKFANAKKLLAEAEKADEETRGLRMANRSRDLSNLLENLERLFMLMSKVQGAGIAIGRTGTETHLFIGDDPRTARLQPPTDVTLENANSGKTTSHNSSSNDAPVVDKD